MNDIDYFDVLIVYSSFASMSASRKMANTNSPFSSISSNNVAYAYFLETCKARGLSAAFSTSTDVVDAGTCSSYWLYESDSWKKVMRACRSNQIFDKLSPIHKKAKAERKILLSSKDVKAFNNEYMSNLFTDKLETYKQFSKFSIPTVSISDNSKQGITKHLEDLETLIVSHRHSADFTNEIILKDRLGAGGNNIYKFNKDIVRQIHKIVLLKNNLSFILQPYLEFQNGFSHQGKSAATDIRLIYQNENLIQTYIRMAKSGDFRCNEHQGGKSIYIDFDDIPKKILKLSRQMIKKINQKKALFALDFVVSDNDNAFFLEGNIGPGLNWILKNKKHEIKSKELIRNIVNEFV